MKTAKVPPRADWGNLKFDPEIRYAYKLFGGKSKEEALPLFARNPIERGSELRFATAPVFNYYIFCFADYLQSDESQGQSDCAGVFLGLVRDRIAKEPSELSKVYARLRPVLALVADRQSFYGADPNIYGSFADIRSQIEDAYCAFAGRGA